MDILKIIGEAEIRELLLFWLRRRPDEGVQMRREIDPSRIPAAHLPHLFLYAREGDGRFLCKLVGTELSRLFGPNQTGRYLDEILPAPAAQNRTELFLAALQSQRPVYFRGSYIFADGQQRPYARILLPVSSAGGVADQIFGMARFGPFERDIPAARAARAANLPDDVFQPSEADLVAAARTLAGGGAARTRIDNPPVMGAPVQ